MHGTSSGNQRCLASPAALLPTASLGCSRQYYNAGQRGASYRKSLFEKAGHLIDQIKTWQDWVQALQDIVVDGQGRHPNNAAFDPGTVKVWGFASFLARGSGASIPYPAQD